MATKLQLYNKALLYCKERSLGSLSEEREPRRLLDHVYDTGGIDFCLEEGLWKFATRSVRIDFDASEDPEFGFQYMFTKPTDWVKTVSVCSDEYFQNPITHYAHRNGFWYSDLQEIYVQYVSNGTDFGYSLGDWPASFLNYVASHFALEICGKLKGAGVTRDEVMQIHEENRANAKNNDAWNQPQRYPATGRWASARLRGGRGGRDFGNTGQLIG